MLSTLVLSRPLFCCCLRGIHVRRPDVFWLDADAGWLLKGRIAAFLVMAGAYLP